MRVLTNVVDDCPVICDLCNADFTRSNAKGGIVCAGTGICPGCAPAFLERVKRFHEEDTITDRATEDETFFAFIMRIRMGQNPAFILTIQSLKVSPADIGRRVVEHAYSSEKVLVQKGKIKSTRTPYGSLKPDHIGVRWDGDNTVSYVPLACLEFEDAWENSP